MLERLKESRSLVRLGSVDAAEVARSGAPAAAAGSECGTLLDVLRYRAQSEPDRRVFTFLQDGESEAGALTCGELYRRAHAVAAALRRRTVPAERALLLFPPGLDFIAAFFGCLYAGVVAVPAYPSRRREDLRLRAIAQDSAPRVVLTTSGLLPAVQQATDAVLSGADWLAADRLPEEEWQGPYPGPEDLAFLQYTSGSTAFPKGVMVRHRNLVHNSRMIQEAFAQDTRSVVVGWLPLYHDMGLIGNVLQPLFCGGACVLMSPMAFLQRPSRWLQAISRYRGTTSGGPDFAYGLCIRKVAPAEREGLDLSSWTVAFNGAEPVRAHTLERFAATFAGCGFRRAALYPCYGLAEATLLVTGGTPGAGHRVMDLNAAALERHAIAPPDGAAVRRLVSCGRPWQEQRVVIADPETGEELPPGRVGEIWIAGGSVAAGYWGRSEESGRDFGARLAGRAEDGVPLLRTGDLGFLDRGDLFVTGRLKDLIILRGRNHYPQDVERCAEESHPAVRLGGAAAFAVEDGFEERLVVVCEVERRAELAGEIAAAIRRAIAEEHEVQVEEVVLIRAGTLPRTSSGKVRRSACRELWAAGRLAIVAASALPREDVAGESAEGPLLREDLRSRPPEERRALLEASLLRRAAAVLRLAPSRLRRDLPLTQAGLDSLTASELQHGLVRNFGTAPSLPSLLAGASLADVAAELLGVVDSVPGHADDDAPRPLHDDGAEHPLSHGQRALWFLERLQPGTTAFVVGGAAEACGELDVPALRRSLDRLTARHPALRTAFGLVGGQPVQRICEHVAIPFCEEDAAAWSEQRLRESLGRAVYAPFDLAAGQPLRAGVFHRGRGRLIFWLALHHLVCDLWSVSLLWRDLEALYCEETGGSPAALPPVVLRYTDFVRWQERRLAGEAGERLWAYWSRRLAGPLPVLDLPTDHPRPALQSHRGAAEIARLPADWTARVQAMGRAGGATPYATLLAGFQALLHRYTGQEDLLVGSSTAGRNAAGTRDMVGYFINPVVLRADLSGTPSFVDHLARTKEGVLEAFAHQDYPFPLLAERLQPARDPSRSPVFQVYFVLEQAPHERGAALSAFALNEPGGSLELAGTPLVSLRLPDRSSQFDLMLLLAESDGGLSLALEYNPDLFDGATVRRFLGQFRVLLGAAAEDPGRHLGALPLLTAEERTQLLREWGGPTAEVSGDACLHELFAAQARRTPRAVAAVHEIDELTYADLDRLAARLARRLRTLGVGPDVLVALCVDRSLSLPVGVLGILKAGGAFLPLDPAYPRERLAFMLADARVSVLVTQKALAGQLPASQARVLVLDDPAAAEAGEDGDGPLADVGVAAESLAYAIYTSGSTGRPKGTLVSHANVVRLFRAVEPWFRFGPQDVWTCFHSAAFDFSVWEIWGALLYGGRVVIVPHRVSRSPEAFHELLASEGVTVLSQTPSAFAQLLTVEEREGPAGPALRYVIFGGEALQLRGLRPWFERHSDHAPALVNMYGITETTVHVTYRLLSARDVDGGAESAIGRPFPDLRVSLLDRNLELVPVGVPGEIHVGGAGLARGYLHRPELTAERFVPDPLATQPGARLYRSGDLARWLPGGDLDYLGRIDQQVKVRGFRIELGEIEATLAAHAAVARAVVVARDEGPGESRAGDRRLIAYVVPRAGVMVREQDLRDFLRDRLPDYMLPAAVLLLAALPLTPTGKVDRRALPSPDASGSRDVEVAAAPSTSTQAALAEIWSDLLGVPEVSVQENFFALGGHSLLATQMVSRVREVLKAELPVSQVFERPTVADLAATVDTVREGRAALAAPPILPLSRAGPIPLSFAQTRLWFLHQLAPDLPVYNEPIALRLRGELREEALARTLAEILRRHEVLQTGFAEIVGQPVQVIERAAALALPRIDLAALPEDRCESELRHLAGLMARLPFQLAGPPLCRAFLLRVSARDHALGLVLHHIVCDGWSLGVFLRELAVLYTAFVRGEASPLRELAVQYADFAVWQREWLQGEILERHLAYWRRRLAGAPRLDLPADRPRRAVPSRRGRCLAAPLPSELTASLVSLSRRRGATLFMTLVAAFVALLQRYTGEEDLTIGVPIANRNRAEIEGLIGFFVNTLPLRLDLSGSPKFGDLLRQVRREVLAASEHQDLPFERLAAELQPERSAGHAPLYQTVLALQDTPLGAADLAGLALALEHLHTETAKFDLTVAVIGAGEELIVRLEYDVDLFDDVRIERLAGHFQNLLRSAAADPQALCASLSMLSPGEVEQLLGTWASGQPAAGAACLHELLAAQVERAPHAIAAVCEGKFLSYGELRARAGRLARRLTALGVRPETRVGLCLERSLDLVVAIVAVLEAGGAYVPLDPDYPAERLQFLLADAAAPVVLVHERTRERLGATAANLLSLDGGEAVAAGLAEPCGRFSPNQAAYVIYTSGSTGVPKGVAVSHASVVRLFTATAEWFGFGTGDVWTLFHSSAFDFSVWELWGALLYGGRLVVVPYWVGRSPAQFHDFLRAERVTVLNQTPSAFRQLAPVDADRGTPADLALRWVIFGGEALEPSWLADWFDRRGEETPRLVNMYGITEITVHATYRPLSKADLADGWRSPIGVPIPDLQIYLLDRFGGLLPVGVPGEMYVGGAGVARGYLGRPALTAERFVPHSFVSSSGERLYRSGDLARRLPDGELEYLGRSDQQVKVRGFRIELGEIEAALARHPEVREAAVLARPGADGTPALVAYLTCRAEVAPAAADLRAFLSRSLPGYMVPARFVALPALPLTPSGKLDRRALPAPAAVESVAVDAVLPRGQIAETLALLWAELLGLPAVGADDDFFERGGHSLLAVRLVSRVREALGVGIPLTTVFQSSTLARLAAAIEALRSQGGAEALPPLERLPREGPVPLSSAQRRLWFLQQMDPGSAAYNLPAALHLRGPLAVSALQASCSEIVRRHEVLRTTFPLLDGEPLQEVGPAALPVLPVVDLSGLAAEQRAGEARALAGAEARRPFDLARGPVLRLRLLQLASEEHTVLLNAHHIAFDGWSLSVFARELAALYGACSQGQLLPLRELPVQYADFAMWQRQLPGAVREHQLQYWREKLAGAPTSLDLPADRPAPAVRTYRGAALPVALTADVTTASQRLGRRLGLTPFMTLLATFAALFGRYSGTDEVLVGTPVASRRRTELEGLIGFLTNTLVLRIPLPARASFRDLLARTREITLEAYDHQDLPFEHLVEELRPERSLSRNPLIQVMLAWQNAEEAPLALGGLTADLEELDAGTARLDLTLALADRVGAVTGRLEYSTELFDEARMDRLWSHFQSLLERAAVDPERSLAELPLLTDAELRQIAAESTGPRVERPADATLHGLVESQAARTPNAVAVVCEEAELSYRELNRCANRLARRLIGLGVGPEAQVGVCMERSLELVISLLAILKAGGAYVPLDPSYPEERLSFLLQDCAAPLLLVQERTMSRVRTGGARLLCVDPEVAVSGGGEENPALPVHPEGLAYVIYTSGSTGRPKGAMNTHRAICNRLLWMQERYGLSGEDRVLQKTPFSFDVSVWEFFWPLLAGARLVVARPGGHREPSYLIDLIRERGVTVTHFVPSMLQAFLAEPQAATCRSLRQVVCSGEALPAELQRRCFEILPAELHNLYGPTEAAVDVTYWDCRRDDARACVPIGRPISNTSIHLVDRGMGLSPYGVSGELLIGGANLSRGYLGRPDLTAERYVPDPFAAEPGGRLYRTGDLACRLADGSIDFRGRLDHQIKIRGFRVELGEVEAVLAGIEGVREAAVGARTDAAGSTQLVAFVVPQGSGAAAAGSPSWAGALRAALQRTLPDYMVPAIFVQLAGLPLSPNGKLDRQALAAATLAASPPVSGYTPPRDGLEAVVAEIWAEVLGCERVGVHDHFLALGGHSLLAVRILSRLRSSLGVEIPLRLLFEKPTVSELGPALREARGDGRALPPIVPLSRDAELPLSFAQQRLWVLDQIDPQSAAYHIPARFRLQGKLDLPALARTFTAIVRRHEVLRTTLPAVDGRPRQVVGPAVPWELPLVDLSGLPPAHREAESGRLAAESARRPFDLAAGPLLRSVALARGTGEHDLLWTLHHAVCDAWSLEILAREIAALYVAFSRGRPAPLPPLPAQYADFTIWQRRLLDEGFYARDLAYWQERLGGMPPALDLPTDRPYPAPASSRGRRQAVDLPAALATDLRTLGRERSATLFVVLAAAFQALLARSSGQADFGLGFPVAGRDRIATENLIGCFVNTLVLRADLSGNPPFGQIVERQRDLLLEAYDHQGLPFERLVDELAPARNLERTPLFQVLFNLREAAQPVELPGLSLREIEVDSGAVPFDLTLSLEARGPRLRAILEYRSDLFDAPTVSRLLRTFAALLEAAAETPRLPVDTLPLLAEGERHQLMVEWSGLAAGSAATTTLHGLFEAQAAMTPEADAVVWQGCALSYRELDHRAERLAGRLRALGVGPEVPVALCAAPSPDLAVGLLGVLKAGGCCLPLDSQYPAERLAFMLRDTGTTVLLTQERLAPPLPLHDLMVVHLDGGWEKIAGDDKGIPTGAALPGNAAYVIYTSGSTGVPKGVLVEHAAVVRYTLQAAHDFGLKASDRILQFASPGFDVLIEELFPAWTSGAAVVFTDRDRLGSLAALEEVMASERVTGLELPAAVWHEWVSALESSGGVPPASLRLVLLGCEKPSPDRLARWERFGIPLIYVFGLTETTITNTLCRLPSEGRPGQGPPIGRPIGDSEIYLCGPDGGPVLIGAPGDLYIGGSGLARGYVRRPDLTAERFVPHPFTTAPGARLCRTGDLGRYLPDGRIDFLGRIDHQVKIRGFRIELGEVEAVLEDLPGVRRAVVVTRPGVGGGQRLVAYVVPDGGLAAASDDDWSRDLRAAVGEVLPSYMVPAAFVPLAALPLDPNGKIDRRALPEPRRSGVPGPDVDPVLPRTATERLLARIWGEVLGVERVGLHDNFFELGGDSILSLQIIARAHREGLSLTPRQLFQMPTVAQLAAVARTREPAAADDRPVTGDVPLTPSQRWFFARELPEPHHWNMSLLLKVARPLEPARLAGAVATLMEHHDALRLRFARGPQGWRQWSEPPGGPVPWTHADLSALPAARRAAMIAAAEVQRGFDLTRGPMLRAVLFDFGGEEPARLLLVAHHLVVDGVSWRILVNDLSQLCQTGKPLPPRGTSFQAWARRLEEHAQSPAVRAELPGWVAVAERSDSLPTDLKGDGDDTAGTAASVTVALAAERTRLLLQEVPPVYHTRIEDVLLTAFARAWWRCRGQLVVGIDLEGHGREDLFTDVDLSRTVGFFTTVFPVALELAEEQDPGEALRSIKEQLRRVPGHGIGYGLLRYLCADPEVRSRLSAGRDPDVRFEYLGQLDSALAGASLFSPSDETAGPAESPLGRRSHRLEVNARVLEGELWVDWTYSPSCHRRSTVESLAHSFLAELQELISHCLTLAVGGFTASDFPLARLATTDLDALLGGDRNVEDLYPLAGMQEGMLFHTLYDPRQGTYVAQYVYTLEGDLDEAVFEHAWQRVIDHHPALRSCFFWEGLVRPLQLVRRFAPLRCRRRDWRRLTPARREALLARYLRADRRLGFDPRHAPLMRLALFWTGPRTHRMVLSFHQMILDGWSLPLVFHQVLRVYAGSGPGGAVDLPAARPYRDYIAWLQEQDLSEAEAFWRQFLTGFRQPTPVGSRAPVHFAEPGPAWLELRLSATATAALAAQGQRLRVTLSTLVQGAWAALLGAYAAEPEVVFGATVAGRPAQLAGVETMVGMFLNTLPVRARIAADVPLAAWLVDLQEQQVEAQRHAHAPLSRIQGWSEVASGRALFDSILVFENYPLDDALQNCSWPVEVHTKRPIEQVHNPLTLVVEPGREMLLGTAYDRGRFDDLSIHRLLGHLSTLLAEFAADPERPPAAMPFLCPAERHQTVVEWNDTSTGYPRDRTVHALFEMQVERAPEALAVDSAGRSLTYCGLDVLSNRLAHRLRRLGVGPESLVGLCAEQPTDLVVGMLGILKAGGAYVPLDPSYPRERLSLMMVDAGLAALVVAETQLIRLPELLPAAIGLVCLDWDAVSLAEESPERLSNREHATGMAYVMYTSGSTGRPKGVAVTHRGIVRLILGSGELDLGPADRIAQVSNTSFDLTTLEVWGALLRGGCLVGFSRHLALAPRDLATMLRERGITALSLPTAVFNQVVEEAPDAFQDLRYLIVGGEALEPLRVNRVLAAGPPERLLNGYGPTEGTTLSTWYRIEAAIAGAATVPIGRPLANGSGYLLDLQARSAPVGISVELYVGGDGLARGYLRRPDLTAERFVPSPFGNGERLYRTGDLVVQRPDGTFEFLGRLDQQIKIRGIRIEPGEVETVLAHDPRLDGAVVSVREDVPGGRALVAYFVARPNAFSPGVSPAGELRASLAERLPAYMVPSFFVELSELPLNQNGKVDRRSLPLPELVAPEPEGSPAPPTGIQELVAGLWAEVLGVGLVGLQDDFFELGGHSLLATQLVSRVRQVCQVELTLRALFDRPTVGGIAELVDELLRQREKSPPLPAIERAPRHQAQELSFAQQRLWFIEQLEPGRSLFNMPLFLRLSGGLDIAALARALTAVRCRHEVLRTSLPTVQGKPQQRIAPAGDAPLPVCDLAGLRDEVRQAEAQRLAEGEARRPFNLLEEEPMRAALLRLGATEHVLLLTLHHVACDGWSLGVLLREAATLYEAFHAGRPSPLPPLPVQYSDFAHWQRHWLQGEVGDALLAYWKRQLSGLPASMVLPMDRSRPPWPSHRGAVQALPLAPSLVGRLRELSRREGVTLFMTLLAGFGALLYLETRQEDLLIGSAIANRNRTEIEGLVGFFVNMLPLRVDLSGAPRFRQLLQRIRQMTLAAYAHQDLPFDLLVDELRPGRQGAANPLLQVAFGVNNAPVAPVDLPGLALVPFEIEHAEARFDLTVWISDAGDGLEASWNYDVDLFEGATIRRLHDRFQSLLTAAAANLDARIEVVGNDAALERSEPPTQRQQERAQRFMSVRRKAVPLSTALEETKTQER
jgi:amino acid adenylation domain-containing protein/non-ribosomal peptide synthase protein (TIGR01720 family)